LGVAIIFLTLTIKLLLSPLSLKAVKGQKQLKELQPKLDLIKKKYADDKQKQSKAMMDLYKQNKVNPFASCLPLLIQLPILIAVFQVFRTGLTSVDLPVYSFISNPGPLNTLGFGFLALEKSNIFLAAFTGLMQYFQTKMLSASTLPPAVSHKEEAKDENMMTIMNKQMTFMMPLMTVIIGSTLPSGLMLYWLVGIFFTLFEQKIVFKRK
jgi:YidC/Oxa1 family membrane protein insertase